MFKRIAFIIFGFLAIAGFAVAQQAIVPQFEPGPRLIDGSALNRLVNITNGLTGTLPYSGTPVLSSCGTSPTIVGSGQAGRLVTGGTDTTCTITFATPYVGAPFCVVSAEVPTQPTFTVSNTAITFSVSIASTAYSYICTARAGG